MGQTPQVRFQVQIKMWACLPATICYLQKAKQHLSWREWSEVRHGINYTLIVDITCFLEGLFESGLARLKEKKLKSLPPESSLPVSVRKKLWNRVGLDHYDGTFQYLTGAGFAAMSGVQPYREGLDALFDMRNVLAHGREATFSWAGKSGETTVECSRENLEPGGTYQKVRDYLIKNRLLSAEDAKGVTSHNFLKDEVAEHFVLQTLAAMSEIVR